MCSHVNTNVDLINSFENEMMMMMKAGIFRQIVLFESQSRDIPLREILIARQRQSCVITFLSQQLFQIQNWIEAFLKIRFIC